MNERFKMFTVLITNISRNIHKIKSEEMEEFDLKGSNVSCLYYLYKRESLTARELCDICGEDKANISRSLKQLEEKGYLTAKSKSQKRYLASLTLTEKGRAVGERITEKIDAILAQVSLGLSDEERAIMYKALTTVSYNLTKYCEKYKLN